MPGASWFDKVASGAAVGVEVEELELPEATTTSELLVLLRDVCACVDGMRLERHAYACACMCMHVYACVCMCMHVCACVCMYMRVYACVCVCMRLYACVCMCMHVYACEDLLEE